MFKGGFDLSPAPTILFHYSTLLSERWRVVKWEIKPEFLEMIGKRFKEDWNLGILVTDKLYAKVDRMIDEEHFPVSQLIKYSPKNWRQEIESVAQNPLYRIARYYDDEPARGQL